MNPFEALGGFTPPSIVQWLLVLAAIVLAGATLFPAFRNGFRLTDAGRLSDLTTGLVAGVVFGVLTGLLWASFNPVKVVPPFIHLRLFAFIPPIVGLLMGRGTGFLTGYVASIVWALMAGAFVPLHTPFTDGVLVGMTGWLPAHILRGTKSREELLTEITAQGARWYAWAAFVLFGTSMLMSVGVAASLHVLGVVPFWIGFWAIGVISDTMPLVIGTLLLTPFLLRSTRRQASWMPQF